MRDQRVIWREGVKMRKAVAKRKILMYAIKRRMDASAAAAQDGKLQDALPQLEAVRQPRESGSSQAEAPLLESAHQHCGKC